MKSWEILAEQEKPQQLMLLHPLMTRIQDKQYKTPSLPHSRLRVTHSEGPFFTNARSVTHLLQLILHHNTLCGHFYPSVMYH